MLKVWLFGSIKEGVNPDVPKFHGSLDPRGVGSASFMSCEGTSSGLQTLLVVLSQSLSLTIIHRSRATGRGEGGIPWI